MIKFLSSSLLVLGLITAVPALAQETQGFDFDFDQQGDGTLATMPAETSREPITAPVRPADKAAPAQDASTAPLPPTTSRPVKAEIPATAGDTQAASPVTKDKDGVIVVIGEPDPPAAQDQPLSDDELYNLFAAPEPEQVTLTPEGLPPTTSVPSGPGEARVEKTNASEPAAAKARKKDEPTAAQASKNKTSVSAKAVSKSSNDDQAKTGKPGAPAKRSTLADTLVRRGDLDYHRWYLAQKAWSRVGTAVSPKTASLAPNRLLYPIDRAGLPKLTPARTGRVYADQYSDWRATPVVDITRFP